MNVSMKRIGGIVAAATVVLLVIWYIAVFRPQQHSLKAAHQAYSAAAQQASQLQQQVASLQALERQIPADSARLKVLDAALPHTEDLQDVLNQLNEAAVASGVQLTAVNPSVVASSSSPSQPSSAASTKSSGSGSSTAAASSPASSPTQQVGLSLTISGNYPATMTFMSNLAHMQRVLVVDSASFSPSPNNIATSLTARVFYAP